MVQMPWQSDPGSKRRTPLARSPRSQNPGRTALCFEQQAGADLTWADTAVHAKESATERLAISWRLGLARELPPPPTGQ